MIARVALAAAAALALASAAPALAVPQGALVLEGSGFAMGGSIETAAIDLVITASTGTLNPTVSVAGGTMAVGDDALTALELGGEFLRDGRFVRIAGTADGADVRLLGRLVEEIAGASVYTFTGTIERGSETSKVIYTAQFSNLSRSPAVAPVEPPGSDIVINEGASEFSLAGGYISPETMQAQRGQVITITNDDSAQHRLASGAGAARTYGHGGEYVVCGSDGKPLGGAETRCDFTLDGMIDATIAAGGTAEIVLESLGQNRFIDPDSPWIRLDVVVLP